MKFLDFFLLFFVIVGFVFIGFNSYELLKVTSKPITINLNGQSITDKQPYYGDLTDLQILGKRFAAYHEYNITKYNCVNYTKDFYDIALSLGFNVNKVQGCKNANHSECHAWVETIIGYEPQTGQYDDLRMLYKYDIKSLP
jgi:hypothetical protein